jgi:D-sedoheptulose 7-phosphate isomerase
LPALALRTDQLELLAQPEDGVIGFGITPPVPAGCLTIGFTPAGAAWTFEPPSGDAFVRQELVETLYHVLWETVHVFLEHLGASRAGAGDSAFLYPFLEAGGASNGLDGVVADVAASVRTKAREIGDLRVRTVGDGVEVEEAAATLRRRLDAGGKVLAFGNGGSATDAMDVVADLQSAGRRALDLSSDSAILTALANDVGPEVLFQRQIIAHGRPGDVALALSTSGGSANILVALAEARRRGLDTIALVGYDGGRIVAEQLADHVIVVPSEYIPRIQEAQATVYHLLCAAVARSNLVNQVRVAEIRSAS